MITFLFSEGICNNLHVHTTPRQKRLLFPLLLHWKRKLGWKKDGDTGGTVSEVGEKLTAFGVLRLREETKSSLSRVLKNWRVKPPSQEQRAEKSLKLAVLLSDSRTGGTVLMLIKKTEIILAVKGSSVFLQS